MPGERKYGTTVIRVAPSASAARTASGMAGGVISRYAGRTGSPRSRVIPAASVARDAFAAAERLP